MTLNQALITTLKEVVKDHPMWEDCELWVGNAFSPRDIWIHVKTRKGSIASHKVPLKVFKRHLVGDFASPTKKRFFG